MSTHNTKLNTPKGKKKNKSTLPFSFEQKRKCEQIQKFGTTVN